MRDTISGQVFVALAPYLVLATLAGIVAFAAFVRFVEYWRTERPWVLGIKAARRRRKR